MVGNLSSFGGLLVLVRLLICGSWELLGVEYEKHKLATIFGNNVVVSESHAEKIWLVGDGLSVEEQRKAFLSVSSCRLVFISSV